MNIMRILLITILGLLCARQRDLADEIETRGPDADKVAHESWVAKSVTDYEGVYVLNKSDGPIEMIVITPFEGAGRRQLVSVLVIKRDDFSSEPTYSILGSFKVDVHTGEFKRPTDNVDEPKLRAIAFLDTPSRKKVRGIIHDGVIYKIRLFKE